MKNFFIFLLQMLTILDYLNAQSNGQSPKFVIPIAINTEEYAKTFYSDNKIYNCEEWLETYIRLYQSNRSPELKLLEPSNKYGSIKHKSQTSNSAKFLFELYYPRIF